MTNPAAMQSIMNDHLTHYAQHHRLSPQQHNACQRIDRCRTPALGGHVLHCGHCHHTQTHYHSCRNRHCPQCQRQASEQWCEQQCQQLLPVNYHHLVFTLPHTLNPWAQLHPEVIYQSLFKSAWAALKAFGEDPKRLNGELGVVAVLHTWGQTLGQHIHLHCLIPSGAWNADTHTWQGASPHYLFPVKALSKRFRGAMVSALRHQRSAGHLSRITRDFDATLDTLMTQDWVVHSKPHLNHSAQVLRYLARYTHKTAISDSRILEHTQNHVTFRYTDYQDRNRPKTMTLSPEEFLRRFLLHILPDGFMRIRHYGFLANCCRRKKLEQIRQALAQTHSTQHDVEGASSNPPATNSNPAHAEPAIPCPKCTAGHLSVILILHPDPGRQRGVP